MRDRLRLGLVGHPVAHSLSPTLHAAAARAVGHPDADAPDLYRLFDRGLAELDPFMAHEARALTGFNVTVPAKVAINEAIEALPDGDFFDQIAEDLSNSDFTAIEELLKFVPRENLIAYLPEEK
jgi:hypothetical protein